MIREIKAPGGYRSTGGAYRISVNAEGKITSTQDGLEQLYNDEIYSTDEIQKYIQSSNGDYQNYNVKFFMGSKITEVDKNKGTFTQLIYVKPLYTDFPGSAFPYSRVAGDMTLTVTPYISEPGQDNTGKDKSSATGYTGFEVYQIKNAAEDIPSNLDVDLSDTAKFQKNGDNSESFDSYEFTLNDSSNTLFSGGFGHIIKLTGKYQGDTKPILTQATFESPSHYQGEEDARIWAENGVRLNETGATQGQSELAFDVRNIRDEATPLDKKGVIKLSKIVAGTSDLLGGAEFGLYVGKWDQIGERDEPFAKAKTSATQIGTDKLHDGKLVNLKFQDIPPGTYTLKELNAPDGYEKTLHTWTVRVFPSGLTLVSLNPTFEEDPTLEEPVNVNDKITVSDFNMKADAHHPTIYPNINEFFEMTFKTKMGKGIRRGNYFTIDLDEKLSLEGTLAQVDLPDMTLNGYVLAAGEKIPGTNTVKYTFTEAVENIGDVTANFTIALSPNRAKVLNDTKTQFTVKVAGKKQTTKEFNIDYSGGYPDRFGGFFWLPDYNGSYPGTTTSLSSAFINRIDNEKAEIQNVFYSRPTKNRVTSRTLYFTRGKGVLGPNSETSYELYAVNNPNFIANPAITGANENNSDMSETMPRSFVVNLDDKTEYNLLNSGTMPADGVIPIPSGYENSYLILKTVSPYDLKQDRAYISVQNVGWYGGTYQYTQTVTSNIVTKPSKIFTQTDLTEGEVLAFNKTKAPMKFTLWKKNMANEVIKDGTVHFKMEVAEDYPDSTPVPDKWKDLSLDLSKQTDAQDPTKSVPLEIEIPEGMTGEYNLIETAAPKGYVVNGMRYRIKVDSSKRTVQLISVKDSAGNPVDYKFKLPGAATETLLTATNPAPLYREQTDSSGKITVDTQLVSIDVLDPQGEYPHAGGLGILLLYALGMALMAYAARAVYKRKKAVATEKGGAD